LRAFVVVIDMSDPFVTSPNLPTDRDVVRTAKEFAGAMTLDLSDDEIKRALVLTTSVVHKHQTEWKKKYPFESLEQVADLLEELEKELAYKMLEEVECLVKVDGTPVFLGDPPVIEWLGKIDTSDLAKYGQDHERKTYEVRKADERGEDFLGQKDNYRSQ
jgi:hypothetical protein